MGFMERIPLTSEIVAELKTLKEQSGVGFSRLLAGRKDIPSGLSSATIRDWLSGKVKTAKQSHLDYVRRAWKSQTPRIKITDKIYNEIRAEMQRTGSSAGTLMNRLAPVPEKFTKTIMESTFSRAVKTMRQDYLEFLIGGLKSLPDKTVSKKMPYLKSGQKSNVTDPKKIPYIGGFSNDLRPITKDELDEIESHMQRTGIGFSALLRKYAQTKPDKLHVSTVTQWLNGQIKRTSPDRMRWVLSKWRGLPDK